jgi:nucleotide-binding universal stress UspA family protein
MIIICGTDFSPPARHAADLAAALARKLGDDLLLVHCITPAHREAADPAMLANLLDHWRDRLADECRRLASEGTKVAGDLVDGAPDEVLTRMSEEKKARLVVVSSVGHRAPERWRLGGVSEKTAESSPVPTLVLRESGPLLDWARDSRPLKIFVAYDFSAPADAALAWASDFSKLGPCEVTVGYVDWPPEENMRLSIHEPVSMTANSRPVQEVLEAQVRRRVDRLYGDSAKIMVRGNWGRPDVALLDMARLAGSDLIVTGTHGYRGLQRLWHGSVSRNLLEYAPQSVVCVPVAPASFVPVAPPRRILAATDFTEEGNLAVAQAAALLPSGGCLMVVHVVPPQRRGGLVGDFMKNDPLVIDGVLGRLRSTLPADAPDRGVAIQAEVLEDSDTGQAIMAAAERFDADLIAVGARNRSSLHRSVSQSLIKLSRRPVVVVPGRNT